MTNEESGGYRVVFVSKPIGSLDIAPGTIAIAPSSDNWNDFGERILIDIVIQPRSSAQSRGDSLKFSGFFGFIEEQNGKSDTTHLRHIVEQDRRAWVASSDIPAFFTMLPDMLSYRRLVQHLGPDEARLLLRGINDIVEADDRPAGRTWLRAARDSQIFLSIFLRYSEAYFTWKNASPILRGIEYEELGHISDGLHIRFHLTGRPNPHDLKFRFSHADDVVPQRFAIVIGKNGVGKSQVLARIVKAAQGASHELTDLAGGRPLINRMIAFHSSSTIASAFPSDQRAGARFEPPRVCRRPFRLNQAATGWRSSMA